MSNRLGGKQGTAYIGTNANQPPNWEFAHRDPTTSDINYSLGDLWLNEDTQSKWVLVSLENPGGVGAVKGAVATWVSWGGAPGAGINTLSGITNPAVFVHGDGGNNVQLTTTIPGLTITGNDGAHTITFAAAGGGGLVTSLEGTVGGVVNPTGAGIINVRSTIAGFQFHGNVAANTLDLEWAAPGPNNSVMRALSGDTFLGVPTYVQPDATGTIGIMSVVPGLTVVENPGPHALVITSAGGAGYLETLTGNVGAAVVGDALNNINIVTAAGIPSMVFDGTIAANTLTLRLTGTGPGTFGQTITTNQPPGPANIVPADANGNWNVVGDGVNIETTGNIGTNTVTISWIGAAPGPGFIWAQVAGAAQALVTQHGYIANNAAQTVFTLPAIAAIGDTFAVTGMNTALGWRVAQNAGQRIYFGELVTTLGAGGYLESTNIRDVVWLVCTETNTQFTVVSSIGNITVV